MWIQMTALCRLQVLVSSDFFLLQTPTQLRATVAPVTNQRGAGGLQTALTTS